MINAKRIALALVAVLAAAVTGCHALVGQNAAGPDPTDSTSPQPASPSPSTPLFDDQPEGDEVAAGSYVITEVQPFRITITIPDGWQKVRVPGLVWGDGAVLGFWNVDRLYVDPCARELGLRDPTFGPTAGDLAAALDDVPGLEATTPEDVAVDGFSGSRVELTAGGPWDSCTGGEAVLWPIGGSDAKPPPGPDVRETLWILDVNGDRLVITAGAAPDAPSEVLDELEAIFDSIQIEAP